MDGKGKSESQSTRDRDIKCFKCLGKGHIAFQCPNQNVMLARDNREVEYESKEMPPFDTIQERSNSDFDVKCATIQFYCNSHISNSDRWIDLTRKSDLKVEFILKSSFLFVARMNKESL